MLAWGSRKVTVEPRNSISWYHTGASLSAPKLVVKSGLPELTLDMPREAPSPNS